MFFFLINITAKTDVKPNAKTNAKTNTRLLTALFVHSTAANPSPSPDPLSSCWGPGATPNATVGLPEKRILFMERPIEGVRKVIFLIGETSG